MTDVTDPPTDAGAAADPAPDGPPPDLILWWVRAAVPDSLLHRQTLRRPGRTACRLTLHADTFRPATAEERKHRRRCALCSPPGKRA